VIAGIRPKKLAKTRPLILLTKAALPAFLRAAAKTRRRFVEATGFKAEPGETLVVPANDGAIGAVLAGIGGSDAREDFWAVASLPTKLPEGSYLLDPEPDADAATRHAIAWAVGSYRFARYKRKPGRAPAELVLPKRADAGQVERSAAADALVRDLINTPAEDLGPSELANAAKDLARRHGMARRIVKGDELLADNYPLIHAVGRASTRRPRLIDLTWGDAAFPRVTLVGKGVCFDSGGLDIKPEAGMKIMKKDMGGAAHALGLASLIVAARLPVRLRVLIAAVDNMIAGNAFKPLDVIRSRAGITVEIGNTDAEGRLILADALTDACAEKPDLVIDFATLTGAARVALGPELVPVYVNDESLAQSLLRHSAAEADPMWRMPLWKAYRARLDSKVADLSSTGDGPFAGSVTAALFLQEFVPAGIPWVHFDLYAWNMWGKPGRPEGAETQVIRAVFAALRERYARA
jgi:leucyl aminopeptidase